MYKSLDSVMAREAGNDDHTLSLMALLQERFRQLQKMKELRREKELLRLTVSEPDKHVGMIPPPQPTKLQHYYCYGRETFIPDPQPSCQLSLSLWPDSSSSCSIDKSADSRMVVGSPPNISKSRMGCFSPVSMEKSPGTSDVDTSLRL